MVGGAGGLQGAAGDCRVMGGCGGAAGCRGLQGATEDCRVLGGWGGIGGGLQGVRVL